MKRAETKKEAYLPWYASQRRQYTARICSLHGAGFLGRCSLRAFSFGTSQIAQTRRGALKQQAGNTCLHATSCKLESPKHGAAHFAEAREPILLIECIPFFVVLSAAKHYAAHMARPEGGKQRVHKLMAQAEPLVFREKVDVQVRGV